MPSDIPGAEVIEEDRATGKRVIRFIRGPIFANIMLADEINRTPPKTQAALLEAMQEYQVTVNGVRFDLDRPLFVLATQNPIEQEGTYPLPEAQLDRFMFNVVIEYPTAEEERRILAQTTGNSDPPIAVVATGEEIERLHAIVREVPAAENVIDYATRLVRATRPLAGESTVPDFVRKWVRWGAGPRAGQALLLGAKARALLEGRSVVALEDIRAVALPVLRHRVLLNFQAEADGVDADADRRAQLLDAGPLNDADASPRDARPAACCPRLRDLELVARVTVDGTVAGLHRSPVPRLQRRVQPVPPLPRRRRPQVRRLEAVRAHRSPLHQAVSRDHQPVVAAGRGCERVDGVCRSERHHEARPTPVCSPPRCRT